MWTRLLREPAAAVTLFGAAALLLGFLREQAIAYRLGLSISTDAFYLGFTIITFLPGLVSGACLGVLAPHHARRVKAEGELQGKVLLGRILSVCTALGLGAVGVLALAGTVSYLMLTAGDNSEKLHLTFRVMAGLSLAVPAICFSTAAVASLNVLGKYALGSATTAISPLTAILTLQVFPVGPWGPVVGMVLGLNAQALFLAWGLSKEGVTVARRPIRAELRPLLHDMGLLATGGLATGLTLLAVQGMVANIGAHAVSSYNFGTWITGAYLGLSFLVLSSVLTPIFSARAAGLPYSRKRLRVYLGLSLVAAMVGTLILTFGASQVIRLFLGRGAISEEDIRAVAAVQVFSALQIPSYLLMVLGIRAVQAYRDAKFVSRMNWLQASITLGLAWPMHLHFGTKGILLAITLSYSFSGICYCLRYRHHRRLSRQA
jgi:peptidoglycan biosynthesis protein MviN/MurJ (putative lipid II flippase)